MPACHCGDMAVRACVLCLNLGSPLVCVLWVSTCTRGCRFHFQCIGMTAKAASFLQEWNCKECTHPAADRDDGPKGNDVASMTAERQLPADDKSTKDRRKQGGKNVTVVATSVDDPSWTKTCVLYCSASCPARARTPDATGSVRVRAKHCQCVAMSGQVCTHLHLQLARGAAGIQVWAATRAHSILVPPRPTPMPRC